MYSGGMIPGYLPEYDPKRMQIRFGDRVPQSLSKYNRNTVCLVGHWYVLWGYDTRVPTRVWPKQTKFGNMGTPYHIPGISIKHVSKKHPSSLWETPIARAINRGVLYFRVKHTKNLSLRRAIFPETPKFWNFWKTVSRHVGVLPRVVKFFRSKTIRKGKFHMFGEKKSRKSGRVTNCAKNIWKLWNKKNDRKGPEYIYIIQNDSYH